MRFGVGVRFPTGPQALSGRSTLISRARGSGFGNVPLIGSLQAEAMARATNRGRALMHGAMHVETDGQGAILTSGGGSPATTIPMSYNDARFSGNTAGGGPFTTGTQSNKDWSENPAYGSGDQCFTWNGGGIFNLSQCRVDWREGPRVAADSGTFNIDQCFINCVGEGADHADGIQAYNPGGKSTVNVTNTCFRSYSDAEAVAVYGSNFIGSDAFFWADSYQGTVSFTNVLIWGGARGVSIYADTGTTHVAFDTVYFVLGNGDSSWEFYDYDIKPTGGSLVVDKWTNVRAATISNGVIVPGALLPSPPT